MLPQAILGEFVFEDTETPIPGSDTGWDYQLSIFRDRSLGAATDTIVYMGRGSGDRSFQNRMTPDRYATLKGSQGTTVSFTDWDGDVRNVFILNVKRETGSRPFLVNVTVDLIEQ